MENDRNQIPEKAIKHKIEADGNPSNIPFGFICQAGTFNLPSEGSKSTECCLIVFILATSSPHKSSSGTQITGNKVPAPSLTDHVVFSSSGSPAWQASEPSNHACLTPYPKQVGNKIGLGDEDSPEERGRGSYSPSTQSWH